jgi:hypothetical protein
MKKLIYPFFCKGRDRQGVTRPLLYLLFAHPGQDYGFDSL